ncbi:MAG: response regulator transcription factor [Actinobacteria bacterium]|nr:response regulator transcription factor [Acidimicrobiaceae bacterium]MBP6487558.1 response regulator transcription factor [Ilumatobacteraceae bacterium]NMD24039.1 response regulator transcription factor [Actinomycetota bacterium]MBP7889138.1 response regulator transcription factor [Ilumatobacteraceae bacterium]MBP8208620.1 response regulator transcription factor [Ilumatobacteraceae bacterium]
MRVLVVDDEVRLAAAVQRGLQAEGFTVDVAHTGLDGLWAATEQRYDAIVLDIMLPGMNGYRVCAELRNRGVDTPILMLTAKDGEFDEAEALDTGADDFLSKPFSYVVLVARLRALIRRAGGRATNEMSVGRVTLHPAARRCTVDGVQVALTSREFAILECLARRAGEVVPKRDILDSVWDDAFDGPDNVVEVHVHALRRKLGAEAIETIRGAGYRLVAV